MRIKCINNQEIEGQLKLNQEYSYIAETTTSFIIKMGNGVKGTYKKERFERIDQCK